MKIGELARHSGLAASKIRFYEASGLLAPVRRGANGYRQYPPAALQVLEIITSAQRCGFTLDEIRALLPQSGSRPWRQDELLASLRRKVGEIERLQQRLADNRQRLLAIIGSIEEQPADVSCATNLERVLQQVRASEAGDGCAAAPARQGPSAPMARTEALAGACSEGASAAGVAAHARPRGER
ncbi:MerR family transcriptional regulator [Solimonas variicoloris]|uniref:MerR family transcriptional regulator n=1 Tax=Solimonas variicoloris TaxID=254408 RepID=UPI000368F585|nr:MerR family transcriptional regulator [Solimonas variicoloris]